MLRVVNLGDLWHSFQGHALQNQRLKLVFDVARHRLLGVIFDAVDPESDDMLVTVFVRHHHADLVAKDL